MRVQLSEDAMQNCEKRRCEGGAMSRSVVASLQPSEITHINHTNMRQRHRIDWSDRHSTTNPWKGNEEHVVSRIRIIYG